MKQPVALALILLAGPALVAAQKGAPDGVKGTAFLTTLDGNSTKTINVAMPGQAACPVAMQAKQGSASGLVKVRKQQPDAGQGLQNAKPGQHIHLILGKTGQFDLRQIAGATVTAQGLSAKGRLTTTPAGTDSASPDVTRSLDVRFTAEDDGTVSAELDLPGFTSVRSIRIETLALKDGSTWTLARGQRCAVTPDPLMLIANE